MIRSKYMPTSNNLKFSIKLLSIKSIATWIGIILLRFISLLPYGILMRLGNLLGNLIYQISPHRKEISRININKCLHVEGEQLDRFVRSNFQAIGRGIFEMSLAWWASDKKIRNIVTLILCIYYCFNALKLPGRCSPFSTTPKSFFHISSAYLPSSIPIASTT